MPSIRFRLEKPTLTGLAARIAAEYGPDARIIDTEESVVGGIGGLFGKRVVDVTVELPDKAAPSGGHEFSMRARVGLAALLDEADSMDLAPAGPELPTTPSRRGARGASGVAAAGEQWAAPPEAPTPPPVSTQGGDFASMLDALRIDVEPQAEAEADRGAAVRPTRPDRSATPADSATERLKRPAAFSGLRGEHRRAAIAAAPTAPALPAPRPAHPVRALEQPIIVPAAPSPPAAQEPATPEEIAAVHQYVWATPKPRSRMGRTTPGAPPPQRTRPGDLLLLVGIGDDAMRVANALRDRMQKGHLCDGGVVAGHTRRRVDDRRGAVAARAFGVRSEQPVIVAYGVTPGALSDEAIDGLLSIDSDQAWLVVDAGRESHETIEWTGSLRGRLQVDAVASLRAPADGQHAALATIGLPEVFRELAEPLAASAGSGRGQARRIG